jgi:hypothetical protein
MQTKTVLLIALICLFCCRAMALSTPAALLLQPSFEDSTAVKQASLTVAPQKGPGFFGRLKNKLLAMTITRQMKAQGGASAKATVGWIALGLVVVSLLVAAAGGSGAVFGWMFLGGLAAGLVSLCLPRSKTDIEKRKKSNTGAIIALSIGIGLIIAIVIAFSASSWH